MTDEQISIISDKARQKRYKKPINRDFNLDAIRSNLGEIYWECNDVEYYFEADDSEMLSDLLGGEEQLHEFKFMFSDLSADCDQMLEDLREAWCQEWFDIFFAAIADDSQTLLGWDSFESDYFGLMDRYESNLAIEEARTKMGRITKADILDGARQCFRIAFNYLSLKSRYEDLKSSMDIIRQTNKAELDAISHVNEIYDKADEASQGFKYEHNDEVRALNRLLNAIDPYSRIWLQ